MNQLKNITHSISSVEPKKPKTINGRRILLMPFLFIAKKIMSMINKTKKSYAALYFDLYAKRNIFKKQFKMVVFIALLIMVGMGFFNENNLFYYLAIVFLVASIILFYLVKAYHRLCGKYLEHSCKEEYTVASINLDRLPHIAKVYGETGAGKDSFLAGLANTLSLILEKRCVDDLDKYKRILYFVDFSLLDEALRNADNACYYFTPSVDYGKLALTKHLEEHPEWMKSFYNNKFTASAILQDYKANRDYLRASINSKYIYDNGLSPEHYFDILFKYVKMFIRRYHGRNFIMDNQPHIERILKNGEVLMAKIFSFNFMKTVQGEMKLGDKLYLQQMMWGLVERLVVIETEGGTLYSNLDKAMQHQIVASGITAYKPYNRHFNGEEYYHYIADQIPDRMIKVLREQDHGYIGIVGKQIIEGGIKRNFFLGIYKNYLVNSLESSRRRLTRKNEMIAWKRHFEYFRYRKLFLESYKEEYKEKMLKMKALSFKCLSRSCEKLAQRLAKITEQMEKNKNDGWISYSVAVSKTANLNNPEISIKNLANKEYKMLNSNFNVEYTFKTNMSFGRYNTHYLEAIKEWIAKRSVGNFYTATRWDPDMALKKEQVIQMGYPTLYNFFNVSQKDIVEKWYRPVEKDND